jgi:pSer/pThr/pTyr-binding forkhead associated (FHA) protein
MVSGGTNQIRLRITGPDGRVHESVSDQESIILGSGAGAAVRIPDPQVSNLHLMLKRERNGVVMVIDLGSEAGTHVAGTPVREPRSLSPGDVISVGRSRVEVLFGLKAGAGPQPAPTSFAELSFDRGASAVPALRLDAPPRPRPSRG